MKAVIGMAVVLGCLLMVSPAFALFTNGGFETGDFSGWSLSYGTVNYTDDNTITWGTYNHGLYAVIDNTATMYGQSLDINPYNGTYMARINDISGSNHATRLSQTDAITQQDIDDGATLYVNWGAALVEPSDHPAGAQPFFGISVSVNGSPVESFFADALAHNSDPTWVLAGNDYPDYPYWGSPLYYKTDTWDYDLSAFSVGDNVTVDMYVADCSWGGHGGYAFLDGIGTTYQPPEDGNGTPVPEPATMLLLGPVLAGLAWKRRA